jgi:predicted nucleic acid-binding protein
MIHLDTNYLVLGLIPGTREGARLTRLLEDGEVLNISSMAWAEFLCGPVASDHLRLANAMLPNPEPILPADAALAATLFNATGRRRNSLPDCLIAAASIRAAATLATNNLDDFRPFEPHGLQLLPP